MMLYPRYVSQNLIMDFNVSYRDSNGSVSDRPSTMSIIALVKHMAIAGQGYMPHIKRFLRVMGMFLRFKDYLDYRSIQNNKFSIPQNYAYDPTELGHFSNVIGKAFADYLVKEIDSVKLTLNYEAAMKIQNMKIQGSRPDLLCVCRDGSRIAVEAKGRKSSEITVIDMEKYKHQAQSGPIPVNSVVASVAYDLYSRVAVKYYDPIAGFFDGDNNFVQNLIKEYYAGVSTYLNKNVFDIAMKEIQGRTYHVLRLKRLPIDFGFLWDYCPIFYKIPLSILLDQNIEQFAQSGEFNYFVERIQEENIYIDTDGIGLMIGDQR